MVRPRLQENRGPEVAGGPPPGPIMIIGPPGIMMGPPPGPPGPPCAASGPRFTFIDALIRCCVPRPSGDAITMLAKSGLGRTPLIGALRLRPVSREYR